MKQRYLIKGITKAVLIIMTGMVLIDLVFLRTGMISVFFLLFILFMMQILFNLKKIIFAIVSFLNLGVFLFFLLNSGYELHNLIFFSIAYVLIFLFLLVVIYIKKKKREKIKETFTQFSSDVISAKEEIEELDEKVNQIDTRIEDILSIFDLNKDFEKVHKMEDALRVFESFIEERYSLKKYFFTVKGTEDDTEGFRKYSKGFEYEHSNIVKINPAHLNALEKLFYSEKSIHCSNYSTSELYHEMYAYFPAVEFLSIPVISEDQNLALLILFSDRTSGFSENLKQEFYILSQLVEGVLKKSLLFEKMEKLSITDGLTGIYSRRYFNEKIEEKLKESETKNEIFSIALFDIDFFKKCNDNYGHQFGDEVLQTITKIASSYLTKKDIFARYGGEEFIIVFPGLNKKLAFKVLDEIRLGIKDHAFSPGNQIYNVTISAGIAQFPEDGSDSKTLINNADTALYKAKSTGRNKVKVHN